MTVVYVTYDKRNSIFRIYLFVYVNIFIDTDGLLSESTGWDNETSN